MVGLHFENLTCPGCGGTDPFCTGLCSREAEVVECSICEIDTDGNHEADCPNDDTDAEVL